MATHHMMFSFRSFVPYLPAVGIVVLDLMQAAARVPGARLSPDWRLRLVATLSVCLAGFQLFQIQYTFNRSVNGISTTGEYRSLSARDYAKYMQILERQAVDVERHWETMEDVENRLPRILTFAGGMLPYTFRDSYIYEQLVSYRHCFTRHEQALYADYVHILAPRHGTVDEQLPKPEGHYQLVSAYEMVFDGSSQKFLVYYDPDPADHNLTAGINDPCD